MTDMDDEAMKMARRKQAARNDAAEYLRRIGHITGAEADAILRGKWDCRAEVTWFLDQHAIRSGQQFRKGVGIHNERKVILQNKRVNDAIQTALERGELTVSSDGYLAALTPSPLSGDAGEGDEHYTVAMERRPKEIGGVKVGPGLYRIHWKSGGSSLAAIGMCRNGAWWVAPTNWVEPAVAFRVDEDPEGRWSWACVDALERLEPASLPSHQGAGE